MDRIFDKLLCLLRLKDDWFGKAAKTLLMSKSSWSSHDPKETESEIREERENRTLTTVQKFGWRDIFGRFQLFAAWLHFVWRSVVHSVPKYELETESSVVHRYIPVAFCVSINAFMCIVSRIKLPCVRLSQTATLSFIHLTRSVRSGSWNKAPSHSRLCTV